MSSLSRREFVTSTALLSAAIAVRPALSFAKTPSTNSILTTQAAGTYPFKVGAFQCYVISDGTLANGVAAYGPEASEEEKKAILQSRYLKADPVITFENPLLIQTPSARVLIDSGANGAFGPTTGKLASNLAAIGVKPESIDAVFISHAHPDHIAGLQNKDGSLVFKKAEYFISKNEVAFWSAPKPDLSKAKIPDEWKTNLTKAAQGLFTALGTKLKQLGDGQTPIAGISLTSAPGHTPGHSMFEIESSGERLIYTADLVNHSVLLLENPDWSFGFDVDPAVAVASKKKQLERISKERIRVLPYHFPFPGLGNISEDRGRFFWHQELWQWA